ncbi:MAG: DNA-binding protein [Gammaproteobacteria bacterium]|nr:DNA-binding protein [Gammaproteobacteria bacterium]
MPAICEIQITGWQKPVTITGDEAILKQQKTAFFCSQKYPAKAVLPSFDWAEQARDNGICVVSGFHSLVEQNIRDILLMGEQPLIWVIARSSYQNPPEWAKKALESNRLLIISPISEKQQSNRTTDTRNRLIVAIADHIVIGYAAPGGKIESALQTSNKPPQRLAQ